MTSEPKTKIILEATKRTILGKRTSALRKKGILPANIFGAGMESISIQVDHHIFSNMYRKEGETTVIYVHLDGKEIPTLVSNVDIHPLSRFIIHTDLRKVNLKQKVEAQVPVKFIGTSLAVSQKNGVLITQIDDLTIESLPTNIPHEIEVDISQLVEIGDQITVGSLTPSPEYVFVDEPERVIVSVTEHVEETIEVQTATEAPEILTEKAVEGEEGAASPAAKEDSKKD